MCVCVCDRDWLPVAATATATAADGGGGGGAGGDGGGWQSVEGSGADQWHDGGNPGYSNPIAKRVGASAAVGAGGCWLPAMPAVLVHTAQAKNGDNTRR